MFIKAACSRGGILTECQPAHSKRSPAQLEWLTAKYPLFLDHQVNKTGNQFFPSLYEEYFLAWPPTPTEEEISKAKNDIAVATAAARQNEETVRDFKLTTLSVLIMIINRRSTVGCITVPAQSMV